MQKSESIKEIAVALVKAQADVRAAIKDATNPHFRSKYADLGSVVDAVKLPLLKHGITFLQGVHDAEGGVAIETMLLHSSGEWISSTMRVPATKQDAQGYGSAITYGRRYGLQSMCGVPAEDDDGNAASAPKSSKSVAVDVWDAMDAESRQFLQGIADRVRAEIEAKGGAAGLAMLEAEHLDTDEKVAIWSRFDSKERSAMKPPAQRKAA
jgi:hypothetical protein